MEKSKKRDIGLWRLGIAALVSVILCGFLGFGVLFYYFAPRDGGLVTLEVPRLVGLTESEIGKIDGLEINREWIYSDEVVRGVVISQIPHANARRKVAKGDPASVTIYISLGERTEVIPDLVGVDFLSAAAALRSIGARVRTVAVYGDGEDGVVTGTSPKSGCEIRENETVTLFVSRKRIKEPITVPNFCGMAKDAAVSMALSIGLCLGECTGEGRVSSQSISAGIRVVAESYISFECDGGGAIIWPPHIE